MIVPLYTVLMLLALGVSGWFWWRRTRSFPDLRVVFIFCVLGAFVGAKIVYLTSEGVLYFGRPGMWRHWATGKSVLGALLGGYAGVEIAKAAHGIRTATGDWFATLAPMGIAIGRVGCLVHGCCLGVVCTESWYTVADIRGEARWPSAIVEILFNLAIASLFLFFRKRQILSGQHFHIYMMSYGAFRFAHEYMRETPSLIGSFSGYQLWSLALAFTGAAFFMRRRRLGKSVDKPSMPSVSLAR